MMIENWPNVTPRGNLFVFLIFILEELWLVCAPHQAYSVRRLVAKWLSKADQQAKGEGVSWVSAKGVEWTTEGESWLVTPKSVATAGWLVPPHTVCRCEGCDADRNKFQQVIASVSIARMLKQEHSSSVSCTNAPSCHLWQRCSSGNGNAATSTPLSATSHLLRSVPKALCTA